MTASAAGSTGRHNIGTKSLRWWVEVQRFLGTLIELTRHPVQLRPRDRRETESFGEVLPQQTVGVLVESALPRALWITEVDIDVLLDQR